MKNIKIAIIDLVIEKIKILRESAERERLDAIEESKEHKGAMASRYDTFKEEAQYLAGAHNARLLELGKTLGALKSVRDFPPIVTKGSCYAIIEVKNLADGSKTKYFLLPAGGGDTCEVNGEKIIALNVSTPMARALIGVVAGDEVEIEIQKTTKRFSIVSVV